ncbi:DUF2938 domain-containing protein [Bartonella sp. HY329]|uniref:DUF2938 domain-containing protein n=1 Tax=unclassified Bartonella TaxID=2645622 RepID=UPI0021C9753E|nr:MULTISPECIES: DUF2938 domain-containing protein [unclassified Bartonella]UXM95477.1 DUF2938 domain-containing protein [Bartonella sp. HY329]UXN09803.1 DUF2938 domain-containing protein [Bartonella sp. HY328]
MNDFDLFFSIIIIGIGATLIMDLWALFLKKIFAISSLDYRLVGRLIGHMRHGQLSHNNILKSQPIAGEKILGWFSHYLIGIIFAAILIYFTGKNWLQHPSLWPALVMGLISTVMPFFIMQPAFGFGFAANKTPQPFIARVKSLNAHLSFGLGLYIAALIFLPLYLH